MKKFLILAPINSFKYNSTFEYIRTDEIRWGTKYKGACWLFFNTYKTENVVEVSANYMTNLNYDFTKPNLNLTKTYNPDDYPKYDNYDAIEVSKSKNIPMDYNGLIGVPISFIYKLNMNQFELIDITGCSKLLKLNGKNLYARLIIRRKV